MAITQSAMSSALNRLRQYFDDPLLIQVGRHMELTPRAEALAAPVRDILVRVEAAVAISAEFDPATASRPVALTVSDYSLHTVVLPFVQTVARKAPRMQLLLKAQQSYPSRLLERGETDLLIAPAVYCSPDHPSETLLVDPLVCVLDAENPAARSMDLETFNGLSHVVMRPSGAAQSYAEQMLEQQGFDITIAIESFAFASLPDLVRGTDRVALVQGRLAARLARGRGLAVVEPPMDLPPLEQRLQWHSMRGMDPALEWLRAELHAAAALPADGVGDDS